MSLNFSEGPHSDIREDDMLQKLRQRQERQNPRPHHPSNTVGHRRRGDSL